MFQRWIDDFRAEGAAVARLSVLAAAAGVALAVTTAFLCAALFVLIYQQYGAIHACLAGAALFFAVTLVSAICYWAIKRNRRIKALEDARMAAKSGARTLLNDPAALAIALQVTRMIGFKRVLPLLAIGGLAFGIMAAAKGGHTETEPTDAP
jgi:uncharacterized membrane protein YqjE